MREREREMEGRREGEREGGREIGVAFFAGLKETLII